MGISNAHGQSLHLHLGNKSLHLPHVHQVLVVPNYAVFHAADRPQLRLHGNAYRMGGGGYPFGDLHVFLKRKMRAVKHDRGKARPQALDHLFIAGTVIQMHNHGDVGLVRQAAHHVRQIQHLSGVDGTLSNGQDYGALASLRRRHDGFRNLQGIDVEARDGRLGSGGGSQHIFQSSQWHNQLFLSFVPSNIHADVNWRLRLNKIANGL